MKKHILFSISLIVLILFFATPNILLASDDAGAILDNLADTVGTVFTSVVIICFAWAGILYVTASGDPQKMEKAKKAFIYAIIGVVIGLFAQTAEHAIKEALGI